MGAESVVLLVASQFFQRFDTYFGDHFVARRISHDESINRWDLSASIRPKRRQSLPVDHMRCGTEADHGFGALLWTREDDCATWILSRIDGSAPHANPFPN